METTVSANFPIVTLCLASAAVGAAVETFWKVEFWLHFSGMHFHGLTSLLWVVNVLLTVSGWEFRRLIILCIDSPNPQVREWSGSTSFAC